LKLLDLSLALPAENLALDEALLDGCEESGGDGILRFWETCVPFVALGYVCKRDDEVNLEECATRGVEILRRASGGGTVLQAPGVLNYALILKIETASPTENLSRTNAFVMQKMRAALQPLLPGEVSVRGITDLALGDRKFCGNAQRRRKKYLLFHGALLLNCDLELLSAVLKPPPRQPAYRAGRTHTDFVTNLQLAPEEIKAALRQEWQVDSGISTYPQDSVARLVEEKYSQAEWNEKF
jgi:lipoate---protein ligase